MEHEYEDGMEAYETDSAWMQVEQEVESHALPPVPPTSEPQRLLSYVLQILPKYTELELLVTHMRLHATTLEQDSEQMRGHVKMLSREMSSEKEKKEFLEKYAAQVVKERNELLHSTGRRSHKKSSGSSHYTWHSCCKQSTSHTEDFTPSIASFRGEKLQELHHALKQAQDEAQNHDRLRREVESLLRKTQREYECKSVADRNQIQQLQKQLVQRTMLHSNLERKLYDVESALANHDHAKKKELNPLRDQVTQLKQQVDDLQNENKQYADRMQEMEESNTTLSERLSDMKRVKSSLADRVDQLQKDKVAQTAEIDSLQTQVKMLQSSDTNEIVRAYTLKLDTLQKEQEEECGRLRRQIDQLKDEKQIAYTTQHLPALKQEEKFASDYFADKQWNGPPLSSVSSIEEVDDSVQSVSRPSDTNGRSGSSFSRRELDFSVSSDEDRGARWEAFLASSPQSTGSYGSYEDCKDVSSEKGSSEQDKSTDVKKESLKSFQKSIRTEDKKPEDLEVEAGESATTGTSGNGEDLLSELQDLLASFSEKRIKEEEKAEKAHQALTDFEKRQQEWEERYAPALC